MQSMTPLRSSNPTLGGAECSSSLQVAVLALVVSTHKRHFARGLQLSGSTYRRAELLASDRPA
jgi:hypothetical protein